MLKIGKGIADLFALPVEKGALTQIYVATSPDVEGITGKYFAKCRIEESSPASMIKEDWAKLWEISSKMAGL
jgi:hypothetical protein